MQANFLSDSVETARLVSAQNFHNQGFEIEENEPVTPDGYWENYCYSLELKKMDAWKAKYGDCSSFAPQLEVYAMLRNCFVVRIPATETKDFSLNVCLEKLPCISDIELIDDRLLICYSYLKDADEIKYIFETAFLPF